MIKKTSIRFILSIFAIAFVAWLGSHGTANAATYSPSFLTLTPIGDTHAGETVTVAARLTGAEGDPNRPIANGLVLIRLNGAPFRQVNTDDNGEVSATIHETVSGSVRVDVFFAGSDSVLPSDASTNFNVGPAVLEIQTVPAIPGVEVGVGAQTFQSDSNGVIHIEEAVSGNYDLHLMTPTLESSASRAVFSRWSDDSFPADRSINISSTSQLQLGYETSDLVSLQYSDPGDNTVSFSRITDVTVRSSTGAVTQFQTDEPHWFDATRIVRRPTGLESVPIQWGIDSVTIDDSNVVNMGQQRFTPVPNDTWNVRLLLFSATFTAHDALFGNQVGQSFEVTFPNGTKQVMPGDGDGRLTLNSIVRGTYMVRVTGVRGLAPASPVVVSGDQQESLIVVTYVDVAAGAGLALFIAVWLLLIGRPTIMRSLGTRIPALSDRRVYVRSGVTVLALVAALLITFDARVHGDSMPFMPDLSSASAKQSQLNGPLTTTNPLGVSIVATSTPAPQPTPTPTPTPTPAVTGTTTAVTESAVTQFSVSPVFASFWTENGGLPIFGYPIGDVYSVQSSSGVVAQQFERQVLEHHPENSGTPYEIELRRIGVEYAVQHGLFRMSAFQPVSANSTPAGSGCVLFSATSHSVCGAFLKYWGSHGLDFGDTGSSFRESLALFGYPISEPFVDPETGLTVQYFERARFEYHPEDSESGAVVLGRLGMTEP